MKTTAFAAAVLISACAHAKPKTIPAPAPAPLPTIVEPADAAAILEAKTVMDRAAAQLEVARLRLIDEIRRYEAKTHTCVANGDGWNDDGDGKLRIRRADPNGSCPLPPYVMSAEANQKMQQAQPKR